MGCDIHLHTEIRINNAWHHYNAPSVPRNYVLFGLMAGVRRKDVDPVAQPKGLPDDVSIITAISYEEWAGDAHTPSWLSSREVRELYRRWDNMDLVNINEDLDTDYFGFCFGDSWYETDKDFRFVFWFDN